MMLTPNGYRERLIEKKLELYLQGFGAVCIEGPKWCGKTWTSRSHAQSAAYIGDPRNNFQTRTMARMSPELILQGDTPKLIDEWQEVPELWDAVRFQVDQSEAKGQYILTGSATPNHKGVLHSGTARISRLRMSTMSLWETGDSSGDVSLMEIFEGTIAPKLTGDVSLEQLVEYCVRGGWPGNIGKSIRTARSLAIEYLKAVVEDDMYRVDGVKRDVRKVRSLLHSLGRNESTIVSNNTLRKDMGHYDEIDIDAATVSDYLNILDRLFLLDEQPAYNANIRSSRRVLKSPKRHFSDPSLAVAAIGATPQMLYKDLETFGFLFEALCEHDLKIYAQYHDANIFHFRDDRDNEADAVVEFEDGTWGAFEIKLGANQIDAAAKDLLKIKKFITNEGGLPPKVLCVICGLTNMSYQREDGVMVVPITALKP